MNFDDFLRRQSRVVFEREDPIFGFLQRADAGPSEVAAGNPIFKVRFEVHTTLRAIFVRVEVESEIHILDVGGRDQE